MSHPPAAAASTLYCLIPPWPGCVLVQSNSRTGALQRIHLVTDPLQTSQASPNDNPPPALAAAFQQFWTAGDGTALAQWPTDCQTVGTAFQQAVWQAITTIGPGETRSYQWVAQAVGRPKAARAVGQALAVNPLPLRWPCHRVVGHKGQLTGFMGAVVPHHATSIKQQLLTLEAHYSGGGAA